MYHDKPRKNRRKTAFNIIALTLCACAFVFAGYRFYNMTSADLNSQAAQSVKQAVINAAVQCYAVEGVYPMTLEELEKGYGLRVNREKFVVSYEAFASNIMPEVNVFAK